MLKNLPIVRMYGFERLKYKYSDFYSFNLSKHGGTIRLIVKPDSNGILIYLVDISFDHYKDINCIGEMCYE